MKKILISLLSLLLITIIAMLLYSKLFKVEKPLYTKINVEQLKDMNKEKKDFALYLYQDNCTGCKKMKPIINEYIKENQSKIYGLDVNNKDNITYLSNVLKVEKTPTIIFFKNGKETERVVGIMSEKEIKEKIQGNLSDS